MMEAILGNAALMTGRIPFSAKSATSHFLAASHVPVHKGGRATRPWGRQSCPSGR